MAGGGGGAGPAPSIRHQEPGTYAGTQTLGLYTQTFHMTMAHVTFPVFGVCTLAVQR